MSEIFRVTMHWEIPLNTSYICSYIASMRETHMNKKIIPGSIVTSTVKYPQ